MMVKITRKISIITTVIAIVIIASLNLSACRRFGNNSEILETFEVVRGDIIQTVSTSGYVDSETSNDYSLITSGKVIYCLSKGETFSKGDKLIEIDTSRLKLLVSQAEENLAVAQTSLELAKLNYKQALDANHIAVQLARENAKLSEESVKTALTALEDANEYLSLIEEEALSTDLMISQASAQSHSAEGVYNKALINQSLTYWSNLSSTRPAETQIGVAAKNIGQAESQLELAKINLNLAKLDIDESTLYAPYDGIVLFSAYRQGEYAGPGVPAISTVSSDFIIKAEVNETDVVSLQVGQDVKVRLDAYYENEFSGRITKISPISTNVGGVVSFELIVEPEDENTPQLLYGLSASLDITTSGVEDVLYVPVQSVFEENSKLYVSLLDSDGKVESREVVTGVSNYDFIEIKSGLAERDTILVSPAGQ